MTCLKILNGKLQGSTHDGQPRVFTAGRGADRYRNSIHLVPRKNRYERRRLNDNEPGLRPFTSMSKLKFDN